MDAALRFPDSRLEPYIRCGKPAEKMQASRTLGPFLRVTCIISAGLPQSRMRRMAVGDAPEELAKRDRDYIISAATSARIA